MLHISEELSGPLTRFRGAVGDFSREVQNAPWDAGFRQDVVVLFQEKVKPAVSEIEDEVKAGRFANLFGKRIVANAWLTGVAPLTAVVSHQADLAELVTYTLAAMALAAAGGVGKAGAEAYRESAARLEKAKKKQMYFYYQAGQRLQRL